MRFIADIICRDTAVSADFFRLCDLKKERSITMSMHIAAATAGISSTNNTKRASSEKPTWNPNRVYQYLEDMNEGFQSYKRQAVSYYSSQISKQEGDGTMSVDELKQEIKEWFPEYTLTDSEPSQVVTGKFFPCRKRTVNMQERTVSHTGAAAPPTILFPRPIRIRRSGA